MEQLENLAADIWVFSHIQPDETMDQAVLHLSISGPLQSLGNRFEHPAS